MNLIEDPWVPVTRNGRFGQIRFRDVLCRNGDWRLSLPRDDMELACLQMLICLTQVIFMPSDPDELEAAAEAPMEEGRFDRSAGRFDRTFELTDPDAPFMQSTGVKAKEVTPIQKLFVGLPEGNNHALFNDPGEVARACPSCTAIALFNQAVNCPSIGGGFKEGLRGGGPITTLVQGNNLRETVWRNVLSLDRLREGGIHVDESDRPTWEKPIPPLSSNPAADIGPLRGLFWQPTRLQLLPPEGGPAKCDACGIEGIECYSGFLKEKFKYTLIGLWPHPHSPRAWRNDRARERFLSFRSGAPAWTQLTQFLVRQQQEKAGCVPAAVVSQHRHLHPEAPFHLIVGGYRNKQAAITLRRHETVSLAQGWGENVQHVTKVVEVGLSVRQALWSKARGFSQAAGADGVPAEAESLFFDRTEALVHSVLRTMNFRQVRDAIGGLTERLCQTARSILEEVCQPYTHTPKGIRALATARRTLGAALAKIQKGE